MNSMAEGSESDPLLCILRKKENKNAIFISFLHAELCFLSDQPKGDLYEPI